MVMEGTGRAIDIDDVAFIPSGNISSIEKVININDLINQLDQIESTINGLQGFGALTYKGLLDASLGVYPSNPIKGDYYVISTTGTISGIDYNPTDIAAYNGSSWDKIDSTDTVISVNNKTGLIQLDGIDIPYDNSITGMTATNIQDAIDEAWSGYASNYNHVQDQIADNASSIVSIHSDITTLQNTVSNLKLNYIDLPAQGGSIANARCVIINSSGNAEIASGVQTDNKYNVIGISSPNTTDPTHTNVIIYGVITLTNILSGIGAPGDKIWMDINGGLTNIDPETINPHTYDIKLCVGIKVDNDNLLINIDEKPIKLT